MRGTVPTYGGTMSQYLDEVRATNDAARADRERRERARVDPAQQCDHGVSLYDPCRACGVEAGELPAPLTESPRTTSPA